MVAETCSKLVREHLGFPLYVAVVLITGYGVEQQTHSHHVE